ncbi:PAS domain-containing protein [Chondromyces apiculatus]|uniref:Putative PAS/PAC sensor protein n=1 Tax=Chondromyces apiculatus DSM 436 TaxID=1192034 RepID=A0A017TFU9_9BACT|nr:PAS domain-containing protein [Chondromyces apiculatus]EYF07700.1 putative PAS/PAC sensor protein [Chondromyces apiculatus DSM 436]
MSERNEPQNALEAENQALRGQLAEVQAERDRVQAELESARDRLRAGKQEGVHLLMNLSTAICYLRGPDLVFEYANGHYLDLVGRRDILGKPLAEVLQEVAGFGLRDLLLHVYETGEAYEGIEELGQKLRKDGAEPEPRWFDRVYQPLHGPGGQIEGVLAQVTDVTDKVLARRKLEQLGAEREALQEELIRAQQEALRELATPLVPLAEGVIAMPLIGSIDAERAGQILEVLLEGVSAQRARMALLDVTGVRTMDETVAEALLRAARAAQLLGAEVVLTGLGPGIAQALVALGVDFGGITTLRSLQEGIRHALGQGRRAGFR